MKEPTATFEGRPCVNCGSTLRYLYLKRCVACQLRSSREWYNANKHKLVPMRKIYYHKNKYRLLLLGEAWLDENRAHHNAYQAKYRRERYARDPDFRRRCNEANRRQNEKKAKQKRAAQKASKRQ